MIWYVSNSLYPTHSTPDGLIGEALLTNRFEALIHPSGAIRLHCTKQAAQVRHCDLSQPQRKSFAVSHGNLHPGWRTQVVGTRPEVWASFLTISDTCLCFAWRTLWYLMITQKRAQRKLFVLQWHDTHHHNAWLNAYCLSWSKPLMHEKDRYLNARLTNTPIHSSIIPSPSSHLSNTEVMSFWVQSGLAACKNPPMLSPP